MEKRRMLRNYFINIRTLSVNGVRLLLIIILLNLSLESCKRYTQPNTIKINCSAEKIADKGLFYADNDSSVLIKGANQKSDKVKRSGYYSVKTSTKDKYGFSVDIKNLAADSYVKASIWRKGGDSKAFFVASSQNPKLYKSTSDAVLTDSSGWELLELEFYISPNINTQDLKFNVWNAGKKDAYFDDLEITIIKDKPFPVYKETTLHLEIDTSDYLKLQEIRRRSFDVGLLQSTDDDWVKGFAFWDSLQMRVELRLKGDWLDHLYGKKWSFRVKLKQKAVWKRMRVFSLQNPMARVGVNEWMAHQIFISESLLTTRYGFIPLTFKGKNLGLYAYEDHFTKQLVESQLKREGPILRFVEDAIWDTRTYDETGKRNNKETAYFEAAAIKPFSFSKIMEDSTKLQQYIIAQNLLYQYKYNLKSASEIFNVESLAKFFAFADVFYARHGIIWHNLRFYFNPVLCKLEPIAYDCFSDLGLHDSKGRVIYGYLNDHKKVLDRREFFMTRYLFNDSLFALQYIKYLKEFSSITYLDSVSKQYLTKALYLDSLVQLELPEEKFDTAVLFSNAKFVRQEVQQFEKDYFKRIKNNESWSNDSLIERQLDTVLENKFIPNLINCYLQEVTKDSLKFLVKSNFPDTLVLLGVGKNRKIITGFIIPNPKLNPGGHNSSEKSFTVERTIANYLFLTRQNGNEIITKEIFSWPKPTGDDTPYQMLVAENKLKANKNYTIKNKDIVFSKGDVTIDEPILIPTGYKVYISSGTQIDLIDSAMIISYSPVFINGTKKDPVVIKSSDFTANGFTVLQAKGRSKLNNVRFENLNTLNYKSWTLTGALTFYESDVDLDNVTFYRNQCEDALNIVRSDFNLTNSTFNYIFGDAFDSDFSKGLVEDVKFTNIGNDAIDFSGSKILINRTSISGAEDKGISGGEDSHLEVRNCFIEKANIGIASKDLSTLEVFDTKIVDCNYGLVLLQKKPEYGPAEISLENVDIINAKTEQLIEKGSVVNSNGKKIYGKEINVAVRFY